MTASCYYRFHYDLLNPAGEKVDSSRPGEPMAFLEGDERIIPGLRRALKGREAGDRFRVLLAPAEAYGERDPALVKVLPRTQFDPNLDLQPGTLVQSGTGAAATVCRVLAVNADTVTVDGNHPLAGLTLDFRIDLLEVRLANLYELPEATPPGD